MWGAQEKSEGAHKKKFRPALRAGIVPPHLQIASDATVSHDRQCLWSRNQQPISMSW